MAPLVTIERLSEEHAQIDTILTEILAIVSRHSAPVEGLPSLRWRLRHMLTVHLAKEDRHLYPDLKRSPDRHLAALASEMEREVGHLAEDFHRYCHDWDAGAIAMDWPGFCTETQRILAALRQRIRREERELYPRAFVARPKDGLS